MESRRELGTGKGRKSLKRLKSHFFQEVRDVPGASFSSAQCSKINVERCPSLLPFRTMERGLDASHCQLHLLQALP